VRVRSFGCVGEEVCKTGKGTDGVRAQCMCVCLCMCVCSGVEVWHVEVCEGVGGGGG